MSLVHGAIVKESKARKMLPKTPSDHFLKQARIRSEKETFLSTSKGTCQPENDSKLTQVRFILHVEHERSCIDSMVNNWAMMQRSSASVT